MYSFNSPGDNVEFTMGPASSASGTICINEYGVIVIADENSILIAYTPRIFSIRKITGARSILPITINTNEP
ncbi:MAG: hypothetical protein E7L17_14165 [Clostridium sp.]|uniref:hypothetical protein n=1 Tax=Clostridium sp. TaxID=1506 RepID=UPI0029107CB6|nr:hypothetical protein [Clostridium sp.]MDU7339244.1 hypothetical protein [Clostridium sp.]